MLRLAWSNLTSANRRLIAPVLAVALGVGFVAATFIAMATMSSSIVRVVADDLRGYDVVVTPNGPGANGRGGDLLTPAQLAAMSSTPGVRRVDPQLEVHLEARNGAAGALVVAATAPRSDRWVVTSGVGTVDGVGVLVPEMTANVGALQAGGARRARQVGIGVPSAAPLGGIDRSACGALLIDGPQTRSPRTRALEATHPDERNRTRRRTVCVED